MTYCKNIPPLHSHATGDKIQINPFREGGTKIVNLIQNRNKNFEIKFIFLLIITFCVEYY